MPMTYRSFLPLVYRDWIGTPPSPKKGISSPWTCGDAKTLRAAWTYDWGLNGIDCPGLEFVPMVWGRGTMDVALANPNSLLVVADKQPLLLFNEPDLSGQAALSPSEAVTLAHELFARYPNARWISPAPSQNNPGWLNQWRDSYIAQYGEPPPLEGIAAHCYAFQAQPCIDHISSMVELAKTWGVSEVWVTEFAILMGNDQSLNESTQQMELMLNYLDDEPVVTRYAWYTARLACDESEWGSPTETGQCAPLLSYRVGLLTAWGKVYARH
jgi:hypothetical protein